jgi:carbon-monoxide dehydrogenase large subunit
VLEFERLLRRAELGRAAGPAGSAGTAGLVGRPLTRREDARILSGRTQYLDDLDPPGLVHMAFVRSQLAHARIGAVRAPEGADGLVAVLTADALAGRTRPLPIQTPKGAEVADAPHPLLADGEVRYVGQPIAAVVAESRALAEDAAELVEVEYEPLDPVLDLRSDASEDLMRWTCRSGDVEGAFAAAEHVVTGSYALPRLVAVPMETRGALASYDADDDLLTFWCSAQDTHRQLSQLATVLDRPEESIHVILPDVGGAFGSKGPLMPETAMTAIAAMDLRRPVKWAEDRLESFLASYQGRGAEAELELALSAEGEMLGLRARLFADVGAYLLHATPVPPHTMGTLIVGCYRIEAADIEVHGRRTNRVPTGPYRGAGRPEAACFVESLVDDAARALGLDPIELRRRNLIREFPHLTPVGFEYDSGDYERCLDLAVGLARPQHVDEPERLVGTGAALYVERAGGQNESADVLVEPDGQVVVRSSASPHGQGHDTTFAQIAVDRLGVGLDDVRFEFSDSAVVPPGAGTYGSRSLTMAGSALVLALDRLEERRRQLDDGRGLSLGELAASGAELRASAKFESAFVFSSGAQVAVVEVEPATGRLRVLRMAAVDDAGRIVNPLLAEGQVIGGIVQGLGECLVEEATWDEQGQPTATSLADYSLLTAVEIPPLETAFVESPSPLNPLGAKGIGEGGAIGALAAVSNAVADALGGKRVDPPFTAEKLWRALRED